jgi:hypothetical protein
VLSITGALPSTPIADAREAAEYQSRAYAECERPAYTTPSI